MTDQDPWDDFHWPLPPPGGAQLRYELHFDATRNGYEIRVPAHGARLTLNDLEAARVLAAPSELGPMGQTKLYAELRRRRAGGLYPGRHDARKFR